MRLAQMTLLIYAWTQTFLIYILFLFYFFKAQIKHVLFAVRDRELRALVLRYFYFFFFCEGSRACLPLLYRSFREMAFYAIDFSLIMKGVWLESVFLNELTIIRYSVKCFWECWRATFCYFYWRSLRSLFFPTCRCFLEQCRSQII